MSLKSPVTMPATDREFQKWCKSSYDEGVLSGNGSPEGVVSAVRGTLYRRLDGGVGTCLYIKETTADKTGWAAALT